MLFKSKALIVPVLAPIAVIAAVGLAGCSSNNANPSSSPSSTSASPTTPSGSSSGSPTRSSATPSPTTASCTKTAVQDALPSGTSVTEFQCANAGVEYWAAGRATKSGTSAPFFLRSSGTKWVVVPAGEVCGTASAGLGQKILKFCEGYTPSP